LWGCRGDFGQVHRRVENARRKGLVGYDLADAADIWFGDRDGPYWAAQAILDKVLGNNDGKVTMEDWKKAGLPEAHFTYFDKDGDEKMSAHECTSWWMQRKPARTMNLSEVDNPPDGHMKRLGSHKPPLPSEHLVYQKPYPHPREFWNKHMDGYLPANLKGAQDGWPAMNWTREVLEEKFGWVETKLEPKTESRGNDSAYEELDRLAPNHRLSISDYLRMEQGKNMYVVSIIPQVMAWEVAHPSVLLCGSRKKMVRKDTKPPYQIGNHEYPHESGLEWMTHVFEANLWMASGKTRSQFHYDKEWNVNCLLSGRKRWVFINPFDYDSELQWVRGKKFKKHNPLNNAWTDWVYLDPDNVDLIVQHKLRKMDYYELYQEAGDCIFIPYAMLHQVEKLDDALQVAASWMFLPETIYDEEVCAQAPLDEDLPLAAMDTLYMYTGHGIIPQGYVDPLGFLNQVRHRVRHRGKEYLTQKIFEEAVTQGDAILATVRDRKKRITKIWKLLKSYAKEPFKGLHLSEFRNVPLRVWCKPAAEGDEEGPLPCDHGHEYFFCNDTEYERMGAAVKERLEKRNPATNSRSDTWEPRTPLHRRAYLPPKGKHNVKKRDREEL